jgi:MHS family alpha-ketoglutarate permease-like MFS transporter
MALDTFTASSGRDTSRSKKMETNMAQISSTKAGGNLDSVAAARDGQAAGARSQARSIVGGSIGNLIEWYDFHVYTTFSVYFAASFFPRENRTIQLLSAAAVFALGFLLRPVGSWMIGRYADRKGRRAGLTLSVALMCGGSLAIGLCPTYPQIGLAAPVVLLLSRLVQGFSLGGEYGASSVYLSEIAPPGRRGFYSSFHYVTLILGQLLATAVQVVLQGVVFSSAQLDAWAWRVPFLIGAALALVAYYVQITDEAKRQSGFRELLKHPRATLLVFGLTTGGTLAFFTYTVYMHNYLVNTVGLSAQESAWVSLSTLALFMIVQPLFGALSDYIGRRPLLLAFGIGGTFGTWPLLAALSRTHSVGAAFTLLALALLIVTGYTSVCSIVKAELFPAHLRAFGVGVPYSIATAIFGGSAGYVGLWFKSIGHETGFYVYASAAIACTLIAALCMRKSDTEHLPTSLAGRRPL